MPTARTFLGVAAVNGKIYAIGGHKSGSGFLSTNEEYDPVTNTWATKASMPTPRYFFGIAVWQGRIYVIGGQTEQAVSTGINEVYDPSTDSWTSKTSMPTSRYGLSAEVVNDRIYATGGAHIYPGIVSDLNEEYDPYLDSWTTKAPLPTPVFLGSSAVVDGKIHILGGETWLNDAYRTVDLNQIYDPATNTWDFGAKMLAPTALCAAGATTGIAAPKRIYVLGRTNREIPNNQAYNPLNDSWTWATSMPTNRNTLGVGVIDDVLYAIGGFADVGETTKNEQYIPINYIPEFPSLPIVLSVVTATLLAVIVHRRKYVGSRRVG